jgi:hypothetical protein
MASTFNNDDTFNVIEDHARQALVADTKFASGGDLEIKTWEEEHREDVSTYGEHQLPAASVEASVSGTPTDPTTDQVDYPYLLSVVITVGGGEVLQLKKTAKYYAARTVRILQQQHYPDKQLAGLPADLDGGETGAVQVLVQSAQVLVGETERNLNVLRGLVEVIALVNVTYNIPED